MLAPGDVIAGTIRLRHQLGRGGMGSVWVGEHLRMGGLVAVKLMSPELVSHPDARARFEREARLVATVRSPHVVQVHDYGVTDGADAVPYIVMELLDGEDLATRLDREQVLAPHTIGEIIEQLCDVLGEAHRVGIVHRDIKPPNVFVVKSRRTFVKVLDFGVARGAETGPSPLTQTGLVLGTAHYMSPEQLFQGKDIDGRSDLWAVGVLAYEALTRRYPFEAETFGALCLKVKDGHYPPLSTFRPDLALLDGWFARALATNRDHRFLDAHSMGSAFLDTLGAILRTRTGPGVPSSYGETAIAQPSSDPGAFGTGPRPGHAADVGSFDRTAAALPYDAGQQAPRPSSDPWARAGSSSQQSPLAHPAAAQTPSPALQTPHLMRSESKAVLSVDHGGPVSQTRGAAAWWLSAAALIAAVVGGTLALRLYQERAAAARPEEPSSPSAASVVDPSAGSAPAPSASIDAPKSDAEGGGTPARDAAHGSEPAGTIAPSAPATTASDEGAGGAGTVAPSDRPEPTSAPVGPKPPPPRSPSPATGNPRPPRAPQPPPAATTGEGKWGF